MAAEDDEPNRAIGARPNAAGDDQRNHARDERKSRHQNRPETIAAGANHCVVRAETSGLELVGVVDLQNRVFLDDAKEDQQAKRREDIQRLPEDDDGQQREWQRQRQRQKNRDRMEPRLELRRENQIHEDQRQDEGQQEVLGRTAELL